MFSISIFDRGTVSRGSWRIKIDLSCILSPYLLGLINLYDPLGSFSIKANRYFYMVVVLFVFAEYYSQSMLSTELVYVLLPSEPTS